MSPDRKPRVRCPWCGYDVSRLPKGTVCPECGGRLEASDYAHAAEQEAASWRGMWLMVLLAPGAGMWAGVLTSMLVPNVSDTLLQMFPPGFWAGTVVLLLVPRLLESRVVAPDVRRVQVRLFAAAAFGGLVIAMGLVVVVANLAAIRAWLATVNIVSGPTGASLLAGFIGMVTGFLWALPIGRTRRMWLKR